MTSKSLVAGMALAAMIAGAAPAFAKSKDALAISVYNPGEKGVFAVSSEIVSGPHEVMLVDAQFSATDARALVAQIKATGKTLKTVYISHSDPDYYFGLETIHAAFPDAKIVATPQTVAAIRASKDGKLAFWGPILKDNAPTSVIVPEPLTGNMLTVDGKALNIVGLDGPTPDRTFLWVPSNRAVIGGIPVVANEHVWIADTQTSQSRADWKKTLDAITALKPLMVVPGHYSVNRDGSQPFTLAAVKFTRDYLDAFEVEAAKATDSGALIAAMKRRYPGLAGEDSLTTSAKVIKGEMKWPTEDPAN
ncbi:MBL fold metallo-hydrolase [Sphingobium sp. CR2-8]|uniref:MBL fold metallo-hydrolase n=1 Tax=Sphingobium sp. CR2-8 TaxID=1306534 RepID=UPI002DBA0F89|nr:MBL fold metallo-hydrolase [Sphingobium sp. CR2-8]MEC3911943.1 MBL fold metallo-hydrolase [Sphingobium sp. CR2-8]